MYLDLSRAIALSQEIERHISQIPSLIICPSPIHLERIQKFFVNHNKIKICSQNISEYPLGGHTGGTAAETVKEIGCEYVLLGHSECRKEYGEDDFLVSRKLVSALDNNLTPIICIGEPISVRENGKTNDYIEQQIKNSIPAEFRQSELIVAYEPIWSIGSGIIPSNTEIEEILFLIKNLLPKSTILYGGSVNSENIKEITKTQLGGILVGKASTDINNFIQIIKSIIHLQNSKTCCSIERKKPIILD